MVMILSECGSFFYSKVLQCVFAASDLKNKDNSAIFKKKHCKNEISVSSRTLIPLLNQNGLRSGARLEPIVNACFFF